MGNSHCVPRVGGENVGDYLRRMFKNNTNNADRLVYEALKEEQRQREQAEKRKGIWQRIKKRMTTGRHDDMSDEEVIEAYRPQENEFTEARRLHQNSSSKREKFKTDNPYSKEDFDKWRQHQENVITSIRTTMSEHREGSILYQNGTISPMASSTPRIFLRRGSSPIFQYHSKDKIDWKKINSSRRSVREIAGDTPAPWTHKDYGSEPWGEENENRCNTTVNILSGKDDELMIPQNNRKLSELEGDCKRWSQSKIDERLEYFKKKWRLDKEVNEVNEDNTDSNAQVSPEDDEFECPDAEPDVDDQDLNLPVSPEPEHNKTPEPTGIKQQERENCSPMDVFQRFEKNKHCTDIERLDFKHGEFKKEPSSSERKKKSFAKKIGAFFGSAFSSSNFGGGDTPSSKTSKTEEKKTSDNVAKLEQVEVPETKTVARKAEAFFVSFGKDEQENTDNVKKSFTKRFPYKVKVAPDTEKKERPVKKAEALFIPAFEPSESDPGQWSGRKSPERDDRFKRKKTKYGSVEHHNQIKTDNEIRTNRLEEIQTKVDSWKVSETDDNCLQSGLNAFEPVPKSVKYGSVAHNNMIKKDNAMRKKRIDNASTKVDSWKTNEEDDSSLYHPNMRNYKPAHKPAQYGSVEHNNQIKRDNFLRKKKPDDIHTTLDCWKTKEINYSYLQPKMRDYELAPKRAGYGSVEHNNQIKKNNAERQMRLGKIQSTLDTWSSPNPGSKYSLQRKDEWEPILDPKKYGTAAHFHQIKGDNAMRKNRLNKIHSNLDTWNAPNPGSRYSLKRKDEWEPVLDPKKYGTTAHFHQIKSDNAMRKRRLNTIQSNVDTWNTKNPGSKYSLQRKDEWEPVYDIRKFGSVAHFHQVRKTHAYNRSMINNASTKLNTWQPKSKMNLLHASNQKGIEKNPNMKNQKASATYVRQGIDRGKNIQRSADHSVSSWSRHITDRSLSSRQSISGREETPDYRNEETPEYRYEKTLNYRNKENPEYGNEETPEYRYEKTLNYRNKENPEYGYEETPEYRYEKTMNYRHKETPEYGYEETPEYGYEKTMNYRNKENPEYGYEETPEYGYEETPDYSNKETPEYGYEETPEYRYEKTTEYGYEKTPTPRGLRRSLRQ